MIVKKIPFFRGFPDFEEARNLAASIFKFSEFNPIFYDIETTGLSRSTHFVYLIGAVQWEINQWVLTQWFAETEEEEPEILRCFSDVLEKHTCTIQYNGSRFDQPFLKARYAACQMNDPFEAMQEADLYHALKPCQKLLKLAHMKQPDLEAFLGLPGRIFPDGRECIRLYRLFASGIQKQSPDPMLGHNQEDLSGLGSLCPMLGYLCLYRGNFSLLHMEKDGDQILAVLSLPYSLPVPVSAGCQGIYLTAENKTARMLLPVTEGKLKQYYDNYKDYDYLPAEDTAIPKSLSAYMDRSLRTPATRDTCYTWFPVSEQFFSDTAMQERYLRSALSYFLWKLP